MRSNAVLRIFVVVVVACLCAFTRVAQAQTVCTDQWDCDADGIDNVDDPCPTGFTALPVNFHDAPRRQTAQTPKKTRLGFRDIRCYDAFLPEVIGACVPVAARVIAEDVPNNALDAARGKTRRAGFVWVGTYRGETERDGPLGLEIAPASQVRDSFERIGVGPLLGDLPMNTLFACMGAVEFDATTGIQRGSVTRVVPTIYGFEVVANYVRAVREAAAQAPDPDNFADPIGLIREVRAGVGARGEAGCQ